jgi:hypothetical protein
VLNEHDRDAVHDLVHGVAVVHDLVVRFLDRVQATAPIS